MKQHLIHLHPLGKTVYANHQSSLMDVLHEYGLEFPCGGKGTCGKCKVKLLKGQLHVSDNHQKTLRQQGLGSEWRMACMSTLISDITLELDQFNHVILADESEFVFQAGRGYGIAVDLGTSTLVAQLIDLSTAQVMAVETSLNPQSKYGTDVIARIQSSLNGNAHTLSALIRTHIGTMIEQLLAKHLVPISRIVLVGNTVMHHLFCGFDLTPLATYPFQTTLLQGVTMNATELGWPISDFTSVYFYPSIGGFVGSDIVAGIAAAGFMHRNEYSALIDLGTNAEIVVGNRHRLVCASTAAGPAFEGTHISVGMRATTGAISSFELHQKEWNYHTIGNVSPKGICGSALIDAIALLRETDKIGIFGEINSRESHIELVAGLSLTQKDIYEFLLAKAAIATGLTLLCNQLSLQVHELQRVYIVGGFGHYVNSDHLLQTGMIAIEKSKIHKLGNSALLGAKVLLLSDMQEVEAILSKTQHIHLESNPHFQDEFVNQLMLPEKTDASFS